MATYKTYEEAHSAACTLARLLKRDAGLGKLKTYEGHNYEVFSLPGPAFRYGRDATCQVVTPTEPRMADDPNVIT
jgi:hypothetical protein